MSEEETPIATTVVNLFEDGSVRMKATGDTNRMNMATMGSDYLLPKIPLETRINSQ